MQLDAEKVNRAAERTGRIRAEVYAAPSLDTCTSNMPSGPHEVYQRKVLNNVPSVLSKIMRPTSAFITTEEIAREEQQHGAVQ